MYKSDLHEALARLGLVSGGTVAGLLESVKAAKGKLLSSYSSYALFNSPGTSNGSSQMQDALRGLERHLSSVSPFSTAVELHALGARFDEVMGQFPQFGDFLRPGRQAVAGLSGAFDLALQQNRNPPSLLGIVEPASALAIAYEHYSALMGVVAPDAMQHSEAFGTIEIKSATDLQSFANFVALLYSLASVAGAVVESAELESSDGQTIRIAQIESGSPIRISLIGGSGAIKLLLSMLRDVARTAYLSLTTHGRTIQALETLARANELGIDSKEVTHRLEQAVTAAAHHYAQSFGQETIIATIDGQAIESQKMLTSTAEGDLRQQSLPKPEIPE